MSDDDLLDLTAVSQDDFYDELNILMNCLIVRLTYLLTHVLVVTIHQKMDLLLVEKVYTW